MLCNNESFITTRKLKRLWLSFRKKNVDNMDDHFTESDKVVIMSSDEEYFVFESETKRKSIEKNGQSFHWFFKIELAICLDVLPHDEWHSKVQSVQVEQDAVGQPILLLLQKKKKTFSKNLQLMLKVCKFNTPALNGRKKFHLQKTKLNDEIKKLFDNFEQKDLPRTMREHFLKKWKKLWTKWFSQITHKNRSHDHDAVGLGRCEHKPSGNQKGNLHLHDIGSYVPKDKV